MTRSLILIGFKACGKTSIGQILAEKQQMLFIDTDQLLIQHYQSTVAPNAVSSTCADIYRIIGEQAFRTLEKTSIQALCMQPSAQHAIIATGGGAILDTENRKYLKKIGQIIYLSTPFATLLARLQTQPTPAFMQNNATTDFQALFAQRDPLYRESADYIIQTENLSILDVVALLRRTQYGH